MTDPFLGRVLGGCYQIERRLGAGGMGVVYVARHTRTDRRYAVKVLRGEGALDVESVLRFRREAKAMMSLAHVGIVSVHDSDQTDDGVPFIVMDLLEGESLADRLARVGVPPWETARTLFLEIAAAVSAAHAQGVLHRDLKPANVFLARVPGAPERAVVLDFGLARMTDASNTAKLTSTGAILGTPQYMSPEQALGEPLDVRTDVYSLGALLFEVVSGHPPFEGPTAAVAIARLLTEPPPDLSRRARTAIPTGLPSALLRALAKKPEDRFASVDALASAVAKLGTDTVDPHGRTLVVPSVRPSGASAYASAVATPSPVGASSRNAPARRYRAMLIVGGLVVGGAIAVAAFARRPTSIVEPLRDRAAPTDHGDVGHLALPATQPFGAPVDAGVTPSALPPIAVATATVAAARSAGALRAGASPARQRPVSPTATSSAVPDAAVGPPAAAGPVGFSALPHFAAVQRMEHSDWRGCVAAARAATPVTPSVLAVQVVCGLQLHDRAVVRAACDEHVRLFPDHPYSRSCPAIAASMTGP